jgi:hypothetical protein
MRDRQFFLGLANQKKRVEFSQSWINRTLVDSEGVCMALACAFIWRNAKNKAGATGPKSLPGMNATDLKKLNEYFQLRQGEVPDSSRQHVWCSAEELQDPNSPTYTEDIQKFRGQRDDVPQAVQDKHLLIAGVTNAISRRIDELAKKYPDHTAKMTGIKSQIENMPALKQIKLQGGGSDGVSDEFFYVFVIRRSDEKYKLFDPNNGIITFGTADELLQAFNIYHEGNPSLLRFV